MKRSCRPTHTNGCVIPKSTSVSYVRTSLRPRSSSGQIPSRHGHETLDDASLTDLLLKRYGIKPATGPAADSTTPAKDKVRFYAQRTKSALDSRTPTNSQTATTKLIKAASCGILPNDERIAERYNRPGKCVREAWVCDDKTKDPPGNSFVCSSPPFRHEKTFNSNTSTNFARGYGRFSKDHIGQEKRRETCLSPVRSQDLPYCFRLLTNTSSHRSRSASRYGNTISDHLRLHGNERPRWNVQRSYDATHRCGSLISKPWFYTHSVVSSNYRPAPFFHKRPSSPEACRMRPQPSWWKKMHGASYSQWDAFDRTRFYPYSRSNSCGFHRTYLAPSHAVAWRPRPGVSRCGRYARPNFAKEAASERQFDSKNKLTESFKKPTSDTDAPESIRSCDYRDGDPDTEVRQLELGRRCEQSDSGQANNEVQARGSSENQISWPGSLKLLSVISKSISQMLADTPRNPQDEEKSFPREDTALPSSVCSEARSSEGQQECSFPSTSCATPCLSLASKSRMRQQASPKDGFKLPDQKRIGATPQTAAMVSCTCQAENAASAHRPPRGNTRSFGRRSASETCSSSQCKIHVTIPLHGVLPHEDRAQESGGSPREGKAGESLTQAGSAGTFLVQSGEASSSSRDCSEDLLEMTCTDTGRTSSHRSRVCGRCRLEKDWISKGLSAEKHLISSHMSRSSVKLASRWSEDAETGRKFRSVSDIRGKTRQDMNRQRDGIPREVSRQTEKNVLEASSSLVIKRRIRDGCVSPSYKVTAKDMPTLDWRQARALSLGQRDNSVRSYKCVSGPHGTMEQRDTRDTGHTDKTGHTTRRLQKIILPDARLLSNDGLRKDRTRTEMRGNEEQSSNGAKLRKHLQNQKKHLVLRTCSNESKNQTRSQPNTPFKRKEFLKPTESRMLKKATSDTATSVTTKPLVRNTRVTKSITSGGRYGERQSLRKLPVEKKKLTPREVAHAYEAITRPHRQEKDWRRVEQNTHDKITHPVKQTREENESPAQSSNARRIHGLYGRSVLSSKGETQQRVSVDSKMRSPPSQTRSLQKEPPTPLAPGIFQLAQNALGLSQKTEARLILIPELRPSVSSEGLAASCGGLRGRGNGSALLLLQGPAREENQPMTRAATAGKQREGLKDGFTEEQHPQQAVVTRLESAPALVTEPRDLNRDARQPWPGAFSMDHLKTPRQRHLMAAVSALFADNSRRYGHPTLMEQLQQITQQIKAVQVSRPQRRGLYVPLEAFSGWPSGDSWQHATQQAFSIMTFGNPTFDGHSQFVEGRAYNISGNRTDDDACADTQTAVQGTTQSDSNPRSSLTLNVPGSPDRQKSVQFQGSDPSSVMLFCPTSPPTFCRGAVPLLCAGSVKLEIRDAGGETPPDEESAVVGGQGEDAEAEQVDVDLQSKKDFEEVPEDLGTIPKSAGRSTSSTSDPLLVGTSVDPPLKDRRTTMNDLEDSLAKLVNKLKEEFTVPPQETRAPSLPWEKSQVHFDRWSARQASHTSSGPPLETSSGSNSLSTKDRSLRQMAPTRYKQRGELYTPIKRLLNKLSAIHDRAGKDHLKKLAARRRLFKTSISVKSSVETISFFSEQSMPLGPNRRRSEAASDKMVARESRAMMNKKLSSTSKVRMFIEEGTLKNVPRTAWVPPRPQAAQDRSRVPGRKSLPATEKTFPKRLATEGVEGKAPDRRKSASSRTSKQSGPVVHRIRGTRRSEKAAEKKLAENAAPAPCRQSGCAVDVIKIKGKPGAKKTGDIFSQSTLCSTLQEDFEQSVQRKVSRSVQRDMGQQPGEPGDRDIRTEIVSGKGSTGSPRTSSASERVERESAVRSWSPREKVKTDDVPTQTEPRPEEDNNLLEDAGNGGQDTPAKSSEKTAADLNRAAREAARKASRPPGGGRSQHCAIYECPPILYLNMKEALKKCTKRWSTDPTVVELRRKREQDLYYAERLFDGSLVAAVDCERSRRHSYRTSLRPTKMATSFASLLASYS